MVWMMSLQIRLGFFGLGLRWTRCSEPLYDFFEFHSSCLGECFNTFLQWHSGVVDDAHGWADNDWTSFWSVLILSLSKSLTWTQKEEKRLNGLKHEMHAKAATLERKLVSLFLTLTTCKQPFYLENTAAQTPPKTVFPLALAHFLRLPYHPLRRPSFSRSFYLLNIFLSSCWQHALTHSLTHSLARSLHWGKTFSLQP